MLSRILDNPSVFNLQQKLCNNYQNVFIEFEDYLHANNLNILDIGCSTGICGQTVFDTKNNNYMGIDIVNKYINFAKGSFTHGRYEVMNGCEMDIDDNMMDIVAFIGVWHHMDNNIIHKCLDEVKRVLKPNGHLLIAEPVFTANKLLSNILLSIDRGKYIRESAEYLNLAKGFEVIRQRFFNFSAHRFVSIVAQPNK